MVQISCNFQILSTNYEANLPPKAVDWFEAQNGYCVWQLRRLIKHPRFVQIRPLALLWYFVLHSYHFITKHFDKSHFSTNVSSREHFGTCTLQPCGRSGRWTFQHGTVSKWGLFGRRNFWHEEFPAPWTFRQGIFWHLNILAHGYFGTFQSNMDVLTQTFWHLCYCAENSLCRKVPMSKHSRVE